MFTSAAPKGFKQWQRNGAPRGSQSTAASCNAFSRCTAPVCWAEASGNRTRSRGSVLHLLPCVSLFLQLPQLLSPPTFNHSVHTRDMPVKPVAVFYNLLWIPTRLVTVSHYPCSLGL